MTDFNTITTLEQVWDIPLDDLIYWLEQKVHAKSEDYGGVFFHGPVISYDVSGTDRKYGTFWLFDDKASFYKEGTIRSAIQHAVWQEAKQRMENEQAAYNFAGTP